MRILDMIFYWAKVKPDHLAIIQADTILTFKGLAERINSAAQKIAELDLDPQAPVAVLIQHRAFQLIVCFALMEMGFSMTAVYADLLPHLRAEGINTLIHDGKDAVLPGGKNILFDETWFRAMGKGKSRQEPTSGKKNGNLIFFTSGSTGFPKMTVFATEIFLERLYHHSNPLIEGNYPRTLIIPGIDTAYGFLPSWINLSSGDTICFAPVDQTALLLMSSHRINYVIASPQQALGLLGVAERGGSYQLDSLKAFRIGGGVVTKDLVSRIQASFCPNVGITYGSTEAGTIAFAPYNTIAHIAGAVGIVAPWADLEIVDSAGNAVGPGVEGQVRLRTPLAAENSGKDIDVEDTWQYPGDLGRLTEEGILSISGRVDDVLNRGGVSISAIDLEESLRSCAGVADAGVCGVMGDTGILQIWAGVVPQADFDLESFMKSLRENKALNQKFEIHLDQVLVVSRIPRTQVGKIRRNELREMLTNMSADQPAEQKT